MKMLDWLIIAVFILALVLLQGCTLGPIQITHDKGHLPKVRMATGYEACKLKFKYRDAVTYDCKWDVTI